MPFSTGRTILEGDVVVIYTVGFTEIEVDFHM